MIRVLLSILLIVALAGCSGLKPLNSSVKEVTTSTNTPKPQPINTAEKKSEKQIKFLDEISVSAQSNNAKREDLPANKAQSTTIPVVSVADTKVNDLSNSNEKVSALQEKYAALLDIDPSMLEDNPTIIDLLEQVDEWYGTRYLYGGTGKNGIDCSAFTQAVYLGAFGMSIPRTAAEQFRVSHIISATDLREGDLVFFNTTGGISHVGVYLTNHKFAHASSSGGVKVSDLFESYYIRRYLGAGRIDRPQAKN